MQAVGTGQGCSGQMASSEQSKQAERQSKWKVESVGK